MLIDSRSFASFPPARKKQNQHLYYVRGAGEFFFPRDGFTTDSSPDQYLKYGNRETPDGGSRVGVLMPPEAGHTFYLKAETHGSLPAG